MRSSFEEIIATSPLEDLEADLDAAVVDLAARWTPDALGALLRQALELAALEGREAALADGDAAFAEPQFIRQEFREQIDFLTQKRARPTRAWTDAMQGDHDRAFVVAGATDLAMLEEFHAAVIDGAATYDIGKFSAEFDRIVDKYGWSYNGDREWRIRTIFETNVRTSYMAGRLRQMRDPDVVKLRPFWQYIHGDTRVPMNPRPLHVFFDGRILWWNDPWWDVYFPPNDWLCSCGVKSLSRGDLRRLGKDGPDPSPKIQTRAHLHKATGEWVKLPEGVGYGWDYQPGNLWERGLVPSRLIEEAGGETAGRHAVVIDTPAPLDELLRTARPFSAEARATVDQIRANPDLQPEHAVQHFLRRFDADIGRATLFEDVTGTRLPISSLLFQDRAGNWKAEKRGRNLLLPFLAEAILDPDEIWVGLARKGDELFVDRRYIRVDPEIGALAVFQVGRRWWEEVTAYPPDRGGKPNLNALDRRRGGKLVWRRK